MIFVMGDFNAKIGSNITGYNKIMGKESVAEVNESGSTFAYFCDTFDLLICGSIFKNKRIHIGDIQTNTQIIILIK